MIAIMRGFELPTLRLDPVSPHREPEGESRAITRPAPIVDAFDGLPLAVARRKYGLIAQDLSRCGFCREQISFHRGAGEDLLRRSARHQWIMRRSIVRARSIARGRSSPGRHSASLERQPATTMYSATSAPVT